MTKAIRHNDQPVKRWTEAEVFRRLSGPFPSPAHVRLSGVRNGTGYVKQARTIDALVLSVWPSRGLWMAGIEIKVSLSDWKRELANPAKATAIQQYCDHWYIAAPEGVVPVAELPETWGLIECKSNKTKITKPAPKLEAKPLDRHMLCSLLRNFVEANTPTADVRAEVASKVEEGKADWERNRNYAFENLARGVKEFEEASGVKIGSGWHSKEIGEAVRCVMAMDTWHNPDFIKRQLVERAERDLARIRKAIDVLNGAEELE